MKLLSVKEAAEVASVCSSLVYGWCSEQLLIHYRFGAKGKRGKVMVDEEDLEAFLASCRCEARPEVPPLKHIRLDHG